MSRRTDQAASRAAAEAEKAAASEAARVLQARRQEPKTEKIEPKEDAASKGPMLVTSRNARREDVLDEIRQKRGEPVEPEAKAETPKEEPKEEVEAKEEPKAAPEAVEAAPEAPPAAEAAPKLVKLKVDGEEHEVSQDEIEEAGGERNWRIQKAQENRLKKINESATESRQREERIAKLAEVLLQQQQPKAQPQPSAAEFIKSKVDVIRFGTPEESAAALSEILQRTQPRQVDQNAVIAQTLAAFDRKQATDQFGKDFPEIVSNPLLMKLAIGLEQDEIAKAQRERRPIDWKKTYSTIGNQIRSVVPSRQSQSQTTAETPSNPSQVSEKEARKASITVLPKASARAELPKEEKPETREDSLNRMRKARGLQPQ